MRLKNIIKVSALASLLLAGCDDMFEPNIENNKTFESLSYEPSSIQGLIMQAYSKFNDDGIFFSKYIHEDLATSDFVINDEKANQRRGDCYTMAAGKWSASTYPLSQWNTVRECIQYINIFLQNVDNITWAKEADANEKFKQRLKGEAYALRGIHNYYCLRAHCGKVDGKLMGIPIVTEPEDLNSDFNIARTDFQTSIDQIFSDLDKAIELLPLDYNGDDRVNGRTMTGLLSGRIVKAIKSQIALTIASPLYEGASNVDWTVAANLTGEILQGHTIVPNGNTWYKNTVEIEALRDGAIPDEVLWRGDRTGSDDSEPEGNNYPPSLDGKGLINPTQNLVDAFPMANGYPISDAKSGYNPNDPYKNRDPRLELYIIHNGQELRGEKINTCSDNTKTKDGMNPANDNSTKTGYYLSKFLNPDVSVKSDAKNGRRHYKARIRYTELFLNYAEAQNEVGGPDSKSSTFDMTPREIIAAIRQRGGITNDEYLNEIGSDKDAWRALIHNERRIELMGENFRFWDLRRWKEPIVEEVKGMNVTNDGKYNVFPLRTLSFENYMYFGPIPEQDVLKWSNLKQNEGWK